MSTIKNLTTAALTLGLAATMTRAADPNQIVVDGSTTVGPIVKAFADHYMGQHPEVNITVSESGSGNGAKSLINAACDVASMSRPMKSSEFKAAQETGVLPIEAIIAMDGIALVVHPSNPVGRLTVEQIRAIYTGAIRNWSELGGPDQPIIVISRDTNSGTYETFETMVMNKEKMTGKAEYVGSSGAIRQRVSATPNAIGYVGLAFLEGVKALAVNDVVPSPETVTSRQYPVSRPLYLYTNGRPAAGSHLAAFIAIAKSAEGKKLVEETGFVPLP